MFNRVKIIIASGIYPPDIGGPATYSQMIAEEFNKRGIKASVICYSDKKQGDATRILRKHNILIRYWLYFWNLLKLAKNADIIYAQGPISSGLPAMLVSKILGKKLVLRLGGDYIWERAIEKGKIWLKLGQYYQSGVFKKQGIIFKVFNAVLKSSDLIVFSTKFQRDIYLKHLGLKEEKTTIIKNAFPDFRESFSPVSRSNQVLFAGRLIKLKNLEFLIHVFSEVLPKVNKDIQLRIIGDGPEKKKLQDLVKKLDLEKSIIFEDKVPRQKLLQRIQECYFAVLPSLTEISPNFVLECIKLNKPVLCTRETGLYEDLKEDLVFFDPCSKEDFFDKFTWLLKEDNYIKYQNQIKNINTTRSWSELAEDHLLIFRNL